MLAQLLHVALDECVEVVTSVFGALSAVPVEKVENLADLDLLEVLLYGDFLLSACYEVLLFLQFVDCFDVDEHVVDHCGGHQQNYRGRDKLLVSFQGLDHIAILLVALALVKLCAVLGRHKLADVALRRDLEAGIVDANRLIHVIFGLLFG